MANFNYEVIGLHDFHCYFACCFVESDTSVICHLLVYKIGTKYDVYCECVAYLHSIS